MTQTQVTAKQHYVPAFYMKQFADANGFVQVFDPRAKRILKARPYSSVSYDDFFYGAKTGEKDEISQAFEKAFGSSETRFAERLPRILQRLKLRSAIAEDFDDLAYFMSLQWQRTGYFRNRINRMQDQVVRKLMQVAASRPDYVRRVMKEQGRELTDQELQQVCETFQTGEYELRFSNAMHLQFIGAETIVGFHNLFFFKQWNIIVASGEFRFITTDNPIAEWIPDTGVYGAPFTVRKHYFALTPDVLIESVNHDEGTEPMEQPVTERVTYREADSDETLMFNMVLTNHCEKFCYATGRAEFQQLLDQLAKPGKAMRMYAERYWK